MTVVSYRDLGVWQKAMDLVVQSYQAAGRFPKAEQFGLTSQLQRAAVSVPANIAEGHGRFHTKEYLHHLSIAYGSLMEAETLLLIAQRLAYLDEQVVGRSLSAAAEIGRMLNGLTQAIKRKCSAPSDP